MWTFIAIAIGIYAFKKYYRPTPTAYVPKLHASARPQPPIADTNLGKIER